MRVINNSIKASLSIVDQLCGDEIADDYWKELAIEREKALNDTLEENRSLCELIQGRVDTPPFVMLIINAIHKYARQRRKKSRRSWTKSLKKTACSKKRPNVPTFWPKLSRS